MKPCCPPDLGCNAPCGEEPCALELCRRHAAVEPRAAAALARWLEWERARERASGGDERRFRRRAYERARELALVTLLMHGVGEGIRVRRLKPRSRAGDRGR